MTTLSWSWMPDDPFDASTPTTSKLDEPSCIVCADRVCAAEKIRDHRLTDAATRSRSRTWVWVKVLPAWTVYDSPSDTTVSSLTVTLEYSPRCTSASPTSS